MNDNNNNPMKVSFGKPNPIYAHKTEKYFEPIKCSENDNSIDTDINIKKSDNNKPNKKQNIKIKAINLYHIRGVKSMSVSSVQILLHGLYGDSNYVIVNAKTN